MLFADFGAVLRMNELFVRFLDIDGRLFRTFPNKEGEPWAKKRFAGRKPTVINLNRTQSIRDALSTSVLGSPFCPPTFVLGAL